MFQTLNESSLFFDGHRDAAADSTLKPFLCAQENAYQNGNGHQNGAAYGSGAAYQNGNAYGNGNAPGNGSAVAA